jgi:polyhydroxyalkanoate synthase
MPMDARSSHHLVRDKKSAQKASPAQGPGSRERGGSPWLGRDTPHSDILNAYEELERRLIPRGTGLDPGVAPITAAGAFLDWWAHLLASPAKQWELAQYGTEQWARALQAVLSNTDAVQPLPQDKRFNDPVWQEPLHRWRAQSFLLGQQWWQRATTAVPGVTRHHEQMVSFAARQWLDMVAPSNCITTSPVVQHRTLEEGGANLLRGMKHAMEDLLRDTADLPPVGAEVYEVGRNIAVTPGQVVLRNRLMELIQYKPTTRKVHAEPILIVPAWIMKYYVLDLSPGNSLVKHLVDQGFTVFMISWKNPDSGDRDMGMEDYLRLGVRAALEAIHNIIPGSRVHAAGYCLGGTLLSMTAAALGRQRDTTLKTMTLFAAQTDFSDPGELALFVDESQVTFLENAMWRKGYLDKRQMKNTFQMLRSNDLVWSYRLFNHLLGERRPVSDLMAWNADGTRLPYRMHMEYLRGLFLHNALARGEWLVDGMPVNLNDIHVPIFNVGTVQDHVAPWRSVFKLHALVDVDQTFVLSAGGHNVGIVNPPGQAKSSYQMRHWHAGDRLLTPDEWLEATPSVPGSWWVAWVQWLVRHSMHRVDPPRMGAPEAGLRPLEAAPGTYVHQR